MRYGFIVHALDHFGGVYRYFAQFAKDEGEAKKAFHIETVSNNDCGLTISKVVPATKFEWEHFDWHGDCYNPPNSKHGMQKRKPNTKQNQNSNSKPNKFKKSSQYSVKLK